MSEPSAKIFGAETLCCPWAVGSGPKMLGCFHRLAELEFSALGLRESVWS
jgi:hypothetical protein